MTDYTPKAVRELIAKSLKEYTKRPVVYRNQVSKIPEYPYTAYTVTSTKIDATPEGNKSYEDIGGNLRMTVAKTVEMTFSITCISDKAHEAEELAVSAYEYFELAGRQALLDERISVAYLWSMYDRTPAPDVDYEHRWGFDVRLRVPIMMIIDNVDYIDSVDMIITDTGEILEVKRRDEV